MIRNFVQNYTSNVGIGVKQLNQLKREVIRVRLRNCGGGLQMESLRGKSMRFGGDWESRSLEIIKANHLIERETRILRWQLEGEEVGVR